MKVLAYKSLIQKTALGILLLSAFEPVAAAPTLPLWQKSEFSPINRDTVFSIGLGASLLATGYLGWRFITLQKEVTALKANQPKQQQLPIPDYTKAIQDQIQQEIAKLKSAIPTREEILDSRKNMLPSESITSMVQNLVKKGLETFKKEHEEKSRIQLAKLCEHSELTNSNITFLQEKHETQINELRKIQAKVTLSLASINYESTEDALSREGKKLEEERQKLERLKKRATEFREKRKQINVKEAIRIAQLALDAADKSLEAANEASKQTQKIPQIIQNLQDLTKILKKLERIFIHKPHNPVLAQAGRDIATLKKQQLLNLASSSSSSSSASSSNSSSSSSSTSSSHSSMPSRTPIQKPNVLGN